MQDLEGEENDNGGTENIEDGIGVEDDGFNGIENVGFSMDFVDNKVEFYRIVEISRCKMQPEN